MFELIYRPNGDTNARSNPLSMMKTDSDRLAMRIYSNYSANVLEFLPMFANVVYTKLILKKLFSYKLTKY